MPTYELTLLLRTMPKPELKASLKRISEVIFNNQGLIRAIENLGDRPTPYRMRAHGKSHQQASYFLVRLDCDTKVLPIMNEEYTREIDIIKQRFNAPSKVTHRECTLDNELLPPAYRDDVKKMVEISKRKRNPFTQQFKYNSGLDYYPFQP